MFIVLSSWQSHCEICYRHVSGVMADVLFYAASDYLHIFLT